MFQLSQATKADGSGGFGSLVRAQRLLFATLDDGIITFLVVALIRMLIGKKTAGIMLRPHSCNRTGTLAERVKYWMFRGLSKSPRVSIISIVPYSSNAQIKAVTTHWVHDPQLWDYANLQRNPDPDLYRAIMENADLRKTLAFVGSVTSIKGISFLAEIVQMDPGILSEIHLVIAGKVAPEALEPVELLREAGAQIFDRFVSVQELEAVYDASDMIWCCYRPDYDQASGIFGRAVQFGRCPVVRESSMIDAYFPKTLVDMVSLACDDPKDAARRIRSAEPVKESQDQTLNQMTAGWRDGFKETVTSCL